MFDKHNFVTKNLIFDQKTMYIHQNAVLFHRKRDSKWYEIPFFIILIIDLKVLSRVRRLS